MPQIPNTPELVVAEARAQGNDAAQQASMSLDTLNAGLVAALEVIGSELLLAEEEGQVVAEVAEAGGSAKL
jgi:hypothetical protein|eukprot:COSAG06_NODE_783_length_12361_cov_10.187408_8_plen_71_part_00